MQGLVALARAGGEVVTRDDLINAAWEGRVVSEDAINRVISRVRRVGEITGAFELETVTKVGYRLIAAATEGVTPPGMTPTLIRPAEPPRIPRRLLIGGGALVLGAAVIGEELWRRSRTAPVSTEAERLRLRAIDALRQGSPDTSAQAVAFLKQATALEPRNASVWGTLALAYVMAIRQNRPSEATALETRARAAASRALTLDADQPDAIVAIAFISHRTKEWVAYGRTMSGVLARAPEHPVLVEYYAYFLACTGQTAKAIEDQNKALRLEAFTPRLYAEQSWFLWADDRLDEAEALLARSRELWPRYYWSWFNLFWILAFTGRAPAAIAMKQDIASRPAGIPADDFDLIEQAARTLDTRNAADIAKTRELYLAAARRGDGYATNAFLVFAALGLVDDSYPLLRGVLLKEGNLVGAGHFSEEQGQASYQYMMQTDKLFLPPMASVRADPRFAKLLVDTGLSAYWRETGVVPDFQRP